MSVAPVSKGHEGMARTEVLVNAGSLPAMGHELELLLDEVPSLAASLEWHC